MRTSNSLKIQYKPKVGYYIRLQALIIPTIGYLIFLFVMPQVFELFMLNWFVVGLLVVIAVQGLVEFANLSKAITVHIDKQSLRISHHPLVSYLNRSFDVSDVTQIYVTKKTETTKSQKITYYNVNMFQRTGSAHVLWTGHSEAAHALYVEYEIESFLGIADRSVYGEFS